MNNQKIKTICITGGHITPAVALMDEIRKEKPHWRLVCIGRSIAIEGSKHESIERDLVTAKGVTFLPLMAGRLSRTISVSSVISWLKIPLGFVHAFWLLLLYKPDIVVSFGGYIGVPVAISAYVLRIPIITHEQTHAMGLANTIIANVAARVCLTFVDTKHALSKDKTIVTGLPVRKELFITSRKSPFSVDAHVPIIYITGGSTGAVSINDVVFSVVNRLVSDYIIFHQTGGMSQEEAIATRAQLPQLQKDRYIIKDFFNIQEVSWILRRATIVVGRSGANTVMEAAMIGKPMICIPLPFSGSDEQIENANWLRKLGLGRILLQRNLSGDILVSEIGRMMVWVAKKGKRNDLPLVPLDGAARMLKEINAILG